MIYDPDARRDTPLALKLKARIKRDGPITLAQYMEACLQDPAHGYYRTQPAIGTGGDFITAPEISQVFGELIGLWCAVVWQQMGSPKSFNLLELGPGRGTMMRDMLRAQCAMPGFLEAATIHLVESNEALRDLQRETLAGFHPRIEWSDHSRRLCELDGPIIIVANEFLDARNLHQYVFHESGVCERTVSLNAAEQLAFAESPACKAFDVEGIREMYPGIKQGDVFEAQQDGDLTIALSQRRKSGSHAGLFIDYGCFDSGAGDTLQAVRDHKFEHPLTSPGEADLSAHVDFGQFGIDCSVTGFVVDGPTTQAEFLGRLGIIERASKLMAANPQRAGEIETGVARLMAPGGMGTRFKAIGIRSPDVPKLPGF